MTLIDLIRFEFWGHICRLVIKLRLPGRIRKWVGQRYLGSILGKEADDGRSEQ